MEKKHSIRNELIIFCVSIVLVSMVCQVGFNLFFANKVFIAEKEQQLEVLCDEISRSYTDDLEYVYEVMEKAENEENLKISITKNGEDVYYTSPIMRGDSAEELSRLLREPPKPVVGEGDTMLFLDKTIIHDNDEIVISIWSHVASIDNSVDLFTKINIMISLSIILISIIGVRFFSKKITKPIVCIEKVASNVSKMDFEMVADESSKLVEISSLAKSINSMSNDLEVMIQELSGKVDYHEKLEQMRREFVANISHEMKTPLSMLIMYSESLKADIPGINKEFYYNTIIEESNRLNEMVGQMLDISSIENGIAKLNKEVLNLSEFAGYVMEKTTVLLKNHSVEILICEDIYAECDRKYIEQAMKNYITNAVSHTQQGGEIKISLEKVDDEVIFSVFNEGLAMNEKDIPYIWDSFYRADKARTQSSEKRVGLGLYIVKTIINAHLGRVEAKNVENGVKFKFFIPIYKGNL